MTASYPSTIKSFITRITSGIIAASHVNDLQDEVAAIETELGTDVAGSMTDLKTRLAVSMEDTGAIKATAINARPNVLINGLLDHWQRGTSFAAIASGTYTADRFKYEKGGAMVHTVSQSTDVPTEAESGIKSNYSLKVDCTTVDSSIAAGDFCFLKYAIEGFDYAPMKDNAVTLSFWVKATKTGIYCVSFLNNGDDRAYVVEYTVNTTATWEKKTVTLTLNQTGGTENYTNLAGLKIAFIITAGSTLQTTQNAWQNGNYYATANQVNACDSTANDFYLAQVKLELGSGATPFVARPYAEELALCQRYFCKSYDLAVAPGTATNTGCIYLHLEGFTNQDHLTRISAAFPVTMRSDPTITTYDLAGASGKVNMVAGVGKTATIEEYGENGFTVRAINGAASVQRTIGFQFTAASEL